MKDEKRWVVWNLENVKGRDTKVPYSTKQHRASSTDPSTWATYAEVKKIEEYFSGIGVIFTPDEKLLGIDIDHVIENGNIIGDHKEEIAQLIKDADTYTEISPSGTGLHLYLALIEGLTLTANRHSPFEAYTSGRFFTFTENSYHKRAKKIRTVSKEEAIHLLEGIGYPWKSEASQEQGLLGTSFFSDETVIEKMFKSKKGEQIQALYNGDASLYLNEKNKPDFSRADAALLNYLAFWTRKDAEQMERLWLASPLGSREKTQERKDYRDRTITGAIKNCKDIYRTQEERIKDEFGIEFLYVVDSKGGKSVSKNMENVARILREHSDFTGRFRYDTFANAIEVFESGKWRAFQDGDELVTQTEISIKFEFFRNVTKQMIFDAILLVAQENSVDTALDFVRSIEWDGQARLDEWLTYTYGTPSDEYHRAVASNWLKGMMKRIAEPGCKFDYVLVLEGEQGVKKSTSLHVLGQVNDRSWHVETTMSTDSKDFFMQMAAKAIIEFSEGETLSRTEVKKMKAIITTQSDKYRPPYGRVSLDFPRRCVFAMTTNQEEYLKDDSGNRRWLPIKVMKDEADVEWLAENRDQLFAEAYHRVIELKESVYEFPKEETMRQQEMRRVSDPNEERIADWYYNNEQFLTEAMKRDGITAQQAHTQALNADIFTPLKKFEEANIIDIFKRVLHLVPVRRMVKGVQQRRWVDPSLLPAQEEIELSVMKLEKPYKETTEMEVALDEHF